MLEGAIFNAPLNLADVNPYRGFFEGAIVFLLHCRAPATRKQSRRMRP